MPIPLGILAVAGAGGAAANSYDLLETTVLGSSTTSVTISNLNNYSAYKHLEFRLSLRGDGGNQTMIRLNSDTASNYAYHRLLGNGSTVAGEASANQTEMYIYHGLLTNEFAGYTISLLDFGATNKFKVIRNLGGRTSTPRVELGSGLWRSTSAVTSITFSPAGGSNLVAGSRISVYGLKG